MNNYRLEPAIISTHHAIPEELWPLWGWMKTKSESIRVISIPLEKNECPPNQLSWNDTMNLFHAPSRAMPIQ